MRLNEIPIGTTIKIYVYNENGFLEFNSKVISVMSKPLQSHYGIYIDPIRVNGKLLNFDNVRKKILFKHPYNFRDYEIRATFIGKSTISRNKYVILSPDNVSPIDYRQDFRVPFAEKCSLQIGGTSKRVLIKDISFGGIAFTFDKEDFDFHVGDEVSAQFDHNTNTYRVHAEIVRFVEDGNKVVIGCKLIEPDMSLNLLVNVLQVKYRNK